MELSDRKEQILSAIVERFIATGEPVGSKLLASMLSVAVSSATVRNEMAELSENGFLDQPHTSAGRIPSDKGYRYYIDRLLKNYAPSDADMFRIQSSIDHTEGDAEKILSQICGILADITGCAAMASSPHGVNAEIRRIEAVPVGTHTAMVVATTSAGVLKSRICRTDTMLQYDILELFYNVCASNFIGFPVDDITTVKIQSLVASLGEKAIEITPLIVCVYEAVSDASEINVCVSGQSNLLNSPELGSRALEIINMMHDREAVARLLTSGTDSISMKIGSENEFRSLSNAAVIKASYNVGENEAGSIGVIGPTKIDYSRIIPLVKFVSGLTGSLLTGAIEI